MLYECLTGSVPYPHDADVAVLFAHVRDEVPRVTDVRPDLPPVVDEITSTAMAKRPDDRYSNAADIPGVLAAAVAGSAAAAPPAQPAPPRPQETGDAPTWSAPRRPSRPAAVDFRPETARTRRRCRPAAAARWWCRRWRPP